MQKKKIKFILKKIIKNLFLQIVKKKYFLSLNRI